MNPEIEKLIKLAIADGEITEKERAAILRKAEKLGEDKDEVELILDGELAVTKRKPRTEHKDDQKDQPPSNKVGDIKKCPSCGAPVAALKLKCSECGHEFNKETDSNRQIRDYIKELQNQLMAADNEKIRFLGKETSMATYNPAAVANKKAQIINTFTLPNTKESLIQLLIFSHVNYEATQGNALTGNPLKQAWLGKAIQSYNLLKAQREGDSKIQEILEQYSFLDGATNNLKKKGQIERDLNHTPGSTTKKFLKWGGIGCGGIILVYILIGLFGIFKFFNSDELKNSFLPSKPETSIDSLLTLGLVNEARTVANKIEDDYPKNEALDKIKIYEYKRLLEVNDISSAKNKANSISSDYNKKEALDVIVKVEIDHLIESGDITMARNKANLINSDYERKDVIDKILIIEIDKLIDAKDYENATSKAKQINNSYTRKDALEKINNSKN
jgi:hypothetical protein